MATEDLTFRFNVTGNAVPQFQKVQQQVSRVDRQVKAASRTVAAHGQQYNRTAVSTNKWAKGALQQAGFQVGDFAVQVANGTNKMQAFGQQGSQLLGIFGPVGAILGAGVAILSAFSVASSKAGMSVDSLTSSLGVLEQPLLSVSNSVKEMGGAFNSVLPAIKENIDTALIAAGLYVGFIGTKMVAANLTAAVSTVTLSKALYGAGFAFGRITKMAKAFLPFLAIGALAKGIEMFLRLKQAAGGFGEALSLLKNVAQEVFGRVGEFVEVAKIRIRSDFLSIKSAMIGALNGFLEWLGGTWVNRVIGAFVGAKDAIIAVFGLLPGAFKNLGIKAINSLITPIQSGIEKIVGALQKIPGLSDLDVDLSDMLLEPEEVTRIGDAISDAFSSALDRDYFSGISSGLRDVADELNRDAEIINNIANLLAENMKRPLNSVQAIRDMMAGVADEANVTVEEVEAVADAMGSAGAAAENALTPMQEKMKGLSKTIEGGMEDAFMSIVDGTKSAKEAFKSFASLAIKELYRVLVVQNLVSSISGFFQGFAGLNRVSGPSLGLGSRGNFAPPPRPSFAGGGYTGAGARVGGLDGKGGFLAMMHPRESVIDHTKGQGGGVTVNQTINVSTGVQQTVRTEIKSLMPQIAEGAKSAVVDAKLRGGSYGRSF